MATTPRIALTYIEEGQRSKEASINTNYDLMDAAMQTDLGEFTLVGLPSAAANQGAYAIVTNSTPARALVRSNGTNWKTFSDGTNIIREGGTVS